jgi:hypothetical protein
MTLAHHEHIGEVVKLAFIAIVRHTTDFTPGYSVTITPGIEDRSLVLKEDCLGSSMTAQVVGESHM